MVGRSMSEHLPYLVVVLYYYLLEEGSIIPPNGCLLVDNNEIRIDVSTDSIPPTVGQRDTETHVVEEEIYSAAPRCMPLPYTEWAAAPFAILYCALSSGLQNIFFSI